MSRVFSKELVLSLDHVSKSFEDSPTGLVITDISLGVHEGEFLCVLGPSGCGKTTLLRMMAGLIPPSSGVIDRHSDRGATRPSVLMLFQDYGRSLLPWRRALENVRLGLESNGQDENERDALSLKFLGMVGLNGFERHYPWQLSGGMQQRLALARSLVCSPTALLLDEPFGSVDALTREDLEDELLRLWRELRFSVVFVTHDIDEAIYLGQRVVLLSERPARVIREIGIPLDYPRSQLKTRQDSVFLDLRVQLRDALRGHEHD